MRWKFERWGGNSLAFYRWAEGKYNFHIREKNFLPHCCTTKAGLGKKMWSEEKKEELQGANLHGVWLCWMNVWTFFFWVFLAYKFFGSYHFSAFSIFLVPGVYLCPELASMHKYILALMPMAGSLVKFVKLCWILSNHVVFCCILSNYLAFYACESYFVCGYKYVACILSHK